VERLCQKNTVIAKGFPKSTYGCRYFVNENVYIVLVKQILSNCKSSQLEHRYIQNTDEHTVVIALIQIYS
jgi:hypothetical protein